MKDNSFPLKQIHNNVIYKVLQQIQPTPIKPFSIDLISELKTKIKEPNSAKLN
jgi:hypothetical protein